MEKKIVEVFAEGFINLANTVAAVMIFGRLIVKRKTDFMTIFAGSLFAALMYVLAFLIMMKG